MIRRLDYRLLFQYYDILQNNLNFRIKFFRSIHLIQKQQKHVYLDMERSVIRAPRARSSVMLPTAELTAEFSLTTTSISSAPEGWPADSGAGVVAASGSWDQAQTYFIYFRYIFFIWELSNEFDPSFREDLNLM